MHLHEHGIPIVYRDEAIVVIQKPSALLTHEHPMEPGAPTLLSLLRTQLRTEVRTVHRLDRMTTGAMVLALNRESAGNLAEQFRERRVTKRYLAVARGHMDESGSIETMMSDSNGRERPARTSYRSLGRGVIDEPLGRYRQAWFTLTALELHTGRVHQARRHLHRINHPVVGDGKHGDKNYNRWAERFTGTRQLYLHAASLVFQHPIDDRQIHVDLGVPESWHMLLDAAEIAVPEHLDHGPTVVLD